MYILASFVKDKVSIGTWIYLWAFYFVPLIYVSVFVPVPSCLDDCGQALTLQEVFSKSRGSVVIMKGFSAFLDNEEMQ